MKKLVAQLIYIILILFALVGVSFAWFSMNDTLHTSGLHIVPSNDKIILSYSIYKYDTTTSSVIEIDSDESLDLNSYDSIILENNKNTQIIIKISAYSLIDLNNFSCYLCCSNDNLDTQVLSNIVYFKLASINILSEDPEEIYTQASAYFSTYDNKKTFINNETKSNIIDFRLTNCQQIDNVTTFYLELDYDKDLVARLPEVEITSTENLISYISDITTIIIGGDNYD